MKTLNHLQTYLNAGYKLSLNNEMGKLELDKEVIEFYDNCLLTMYKYIFDYVKGNNKSVEIFKDFIDNIYRVNLDNNYLKANNIDEGLIQLNEMLENKMLTLKK